MILSQTKTQKKQTKSEIKRRARLRRQMNPTAQNTIGYTSQFEEGLMHIQDHEYSTMYRLGDVAYDMATSDEQVDVIVGYANGLNSLDIQSRYQMLILNKRINGSVLDNVLLDYQGEEADELREEINEIVRKRYEHDQNNFEMEKYAVFTTQAKNGQEANRALKKLAKNFEKQVTDQEVDLTLTGLDGEARLKVFADILRPKSHFKMGYKDLALAGLSSKAAIAPRFKFLEDYLRLDDRYGRVLYARQFPKYLEDKLIKEICDKHRELAISIHAVPYDMGQVRKDLQSKLTMINRDIAKQQKKNFQKGISEEMLSGVAVENKKAITELLTDLKENGQKLFSACFCVFVTADTKEELQEAVQDVINAGAKWQVDFDAAYRFQEEAINTILPIGKPYLDVEQIHLRDMTTSNVVTQIPWTTVELQSPTGQYYGQNQLSNNLITIDRLKDLITPSGLIFGTAGAGKGMFVKWSIINTRLKHPDHHTLIVDPESEYLDIARYFGAQILDISTGTNHHLNILDLVDRGKLDREDKNVDLIKEKANLLSEVFGSVLKEFSDIESSLVDRVTRLTYQRFEKTGRTPTLVDWQAILKEQPEEVAQDFAIKTEPYTIGSQDIFAHETNIDLESDFIVFNIKNLDEHLKPFAMKVITDQIWKMVVAAQGKFTIDLWFDELQLNFNTEESATWFEHLWSRIRKYGAVCSGITQLISVLLNTPAGCRMISNSEFLVVLRQKMTDLRDLKEVIKLTPQLMKYVGEKVPQGSGLIYAGGTIVPFENPIPRDTQLFELMNTDAM